MGGPFRLAQLHRHAALRFGFLRHCPPAVFGGGRADLLDFRRRGQTPARRHGLRRRPCRRTCSFTSASARASRIFNQRAGPRPVPELAVGAFDPLAGHRLRSRVRQRIFRQALLLGAGPQDLPRGRTAPTRVGLHHRYSFRPSRLRAAAAWIWPAPVELEHDAPGRSGLTAQIKGAERLHLRDLGRQYPAGPAILVAFQQVAGLATTEGGPAGGRGVRNGRNGLQQAAQAGGCGACSSSPRTALFTGLTCSTPRSRSAPRAAARSCATPSTVTLLMETIMPPPPAPPLRRRGLLHGLALGDLRTHHRARVFIAQEDADATDVLRALGNLDLFEQIHALAGGAQLFGQQPQLLFQQAPLDPQPEQRFQRKALRPASQASPTNRGPFGGFPAASAPPRRRCCRARLQWIPPTATRDSPAARSTA